MRVIAVVALLVPAATLSAQSPTLDEVLARMRHYIADFELRYASVVAEERYEQRIPAPLASVRPGNYGNIGSTYPDERRVLRSDFLVVNIRDGEWIPFRDVFEVDGKPVRDREDRLLTLFVKPTASSLGQASRIAEESTRFNLGDVKRTVNVPTLALMMLRADRIAGFELRQRGRDRIDSRDAWRIDFRETARPTFIRTPQYRDVPAEGSVWVDPTAGTVYRSTIEAKDTHVTARVTVTYRHDPRLEMFVPVEMDETYELPDNRKILGTASYMNFRRFQVSTSESVGKPPGR